MREPEIQRHHRQPRRAREPPQRLVLSVDGADRPAAAVQVQITRTYVARRQDPQPQRAGRPLDGRSTARSDRGSARREPGLSRCGARSS